MSYLTKLLDIIFPASADQILVRETTVGEIVELLNPRLVAGHITLLPYQAPPVQALIRRAKFHNDYTAQKILGAVVVHYLKSRSDVTQVCVPIPLATRRQRTRGHNQVASILATTNAPTVELLVRARETKPQTSLSKAARHQNVAGAFILKANRTIPAEQTIIIVDDVTTTGSTLTAAKTTLTTASDAHVISLAIAH